MKILKVTKTRMTEAQKNFLESCGLFFHFISPTPLSALTAMRISKECDKCEPAIVEVERQEDAIAAISAKKITRKNNFKIVLSAPLNSDPPKVWHKPVLQDIDAWVVPSKRLYDEYPESAKKILLMPVMPLSVEADTPKAQNSPLTISWIGDITDGNRLKQIIDKINGLTGKTQLRICGGGKARDVMPVVRYTRSLENRENIIWVGEEYNLKSEIEKCDACVRTSEDITPIEIEVMQTGRPILDIEYIENFVQKPYQLKSEELPNPKDYATRLIQFYSSL